jgi:hypothetical protein
MVLLPNDGHKITSPVPYALFTRIGNSDTPFLPTYHVYLKQTLRVTHGFLTPPPPTPPLLLDDGTIPPPLFLLVTTCELVHKIARLDEAKRLEAEDDLRHKNGRSESINTQLLVEPLPDTIPDPLSQGDILLLALEKVNGTAPLSRLCVPTPSSSSISSTDDEDAEIDIHSDTSCSSHSISLASEYPPLHCDPAVYVLEMGRGSRIISSQLTTLIPASSGSNHAHVSEIYHSLTGISTVQMLKARPVITTPLVFHPLRV